MTTGADKVILEPSLGIGIITRNRLSVLQRCIGEIARHTSAPYFLMIADDGSTDETVSWGRGQGILVVTGPRRGCAWNKNRALYFLQAYSDCDPILLFEDDTWPIATGWGAEWVAAARRWQHVNYGYGFDPKNPPEGQGTADDPYQCAAFGGHCTITTRRALAEVGFLDSRFVGYGWEHVEWTHRFRLRYNTDWNLPEGMLPCLDHGVRATWPESSFTEQEVDHNDALYADIRANPAEPNYRAAWRDDAERLQMQTEVAGGWEASRANRARGTKISCGDSRAAATIKPPFDIVGCSWPRPVEQTDGRWVSEPEWDAPLMPSQPQARWKTINEDTCWTIDWREFFKAGLRPYDPSLSGEMRGFHLVFHLQMKESGRLVFWADDGCVIRLNGQVVHHDRGAHTPTRGEVEVSASDCMQVAQWQRTGEWLWGARVLESERATALSPTDVLRSYLSAVRERLDRPNGPPLKMYTHGETPVRTVVALYSMILNGYTPSKVLLFGEHQWAQQARELFAATLPFAELVSTKQVVQHVQAVGGPQMAEMVREHWFVMKAFITLLYPPEECCMMDDDVFILDRLDDALEAFRHCDLVFQPDFDWGGTYLETWGWIDEQLRSLPTGTFNAGLFWIRSFGDPHRITDCALRSRPSTTALWVWEQGFIATLYARRNTHRLPTQRYLYPLWDGLPGGILGYEYAANPCGFASIHFGALLEKPSDKVALQLAPAILGRCRRIEATVDPISSKARRPWLTKLSELVGRRPM